MLRGWVERHRYGNAGTPELRALVAEVAGRPLDELFTAWLEQAPLPALPA